jgi:hypothetical protein
MTVIDDSFCDSAYFKNGAPELRVSSGGQEVIAALVVAPISGFLIRQEI